MLVICRENSSNASADTYAMRDLIDKDEVTGIHFHLPAQNFQRQNFDIIEHIKGYRGYPFVYT